LLEGMKKRIHRPSRTTGLLFCLILSTAVSAMAQAASSPSSTAKELVPDYLAWRMFHQSTAFHHKEAASKATSQAAPTSEPRRTPFERQQRVNVFDQAMHKEFGITPEQSAILLNHGNTFLQALERIQTDAKAEVDRRYNTPAARAARVRGPQKTIRERTKEDGLDAQVQTQRQTALDAHLQNLSRDLPPASVAKLHAWVRTKVAPQITIMTEEPRVKHRGLPPGMVLPAPNQAPARR
jgi:hypothetical protein